MLRYDKCNCINQCQHTALGQLVVMERESSTLLQLRVDQESGKVIRSKYDEN